MESKQPEVLRLAEMNEKAGRWETAAELHRLHAENTALQAEILELRNLKIRPPLSDLGLAGLGVKHFGNPIPQGWYKAARDLEAAHGILWTAR